MKSIRHLWALQYYNKHDKSLRGTLTIVWTGYLSVYFHTCVHSVPPLNARYHCSFVVVALKEGGGIFWFELCQKEAKIASFVQLAYPAFNLKLFLPDPLLANHT